MLTALDTAAGVIANSQHTLDSLSDFAVAKGRVLPPAVVAWPGTATLPHVHPREPVAPVFVIVGTIEGRKNHQLLLSVWKDLVARSMASAASSAVPRLVVVGRRGWQAEDVFALLDHHDFQGHVIEVGPLADAQLAQKIRGARALLFPSFAEGFGMPMVEALAAGVPVIASDLEVFREVGQGVPDLLPLSDAAAWRNAVLDYARPDSIARVRQLGRIGQFRAPTWADHFACIDSIISDLSK